MNLYIKSMACDCCIMVVKQELESRGFQGGDVVGTKDAYTLKSDCVFKKRS